MSDSTPEQMELQFPVVKLCECGCGQPTRVILWNNKSRGLIGGQYSRFIKGHYSRVRPIIPIETRFWEKVNKSDGFDSCWIWVGTKDRKGYGTIHHAQKNVYAHRLSWELHFGPIPPDLFVCHKCDNPACIRPDHLFLGTQADNVADMIAKGRDSHPGRPGEMSGHAKLTNTQVREIRQRVAAGERQVDMAREYRVTQSTVSSMVSRKTWRNVT